MLDDTRKPSALEQTALCRGGTLLVERREGISAETALDTEKVFACKSIGAEGFARLAT